MIVDIINKHSKFAIYGAQVVAYGAYTAINGLLKRKPECFIVSNLEGNPNHIEDIPVKTLEFLEKDTLIIIGVTELLQNEIINKLKEEGFNYVFKLTSHEEYLLMGEYYKKNNLFSILEEESTKITKSYSLFEVRHHLDKPLKNYPQRNEWEISIQAGASMTDDRVSEITDNSGDNISDKNRLYSEATVMYWIWKNCKSSWVGIEHYRRHLLVNNMMLNDDIDIIMPTPYICYPNVKHQFTRFVNDEVFDVVQEAITNLYPEECTEYLKCFEQQYHYPFNLMVAKSEVYNNYCEWAFKITEYIEKLDIDSCNNFRVLGYIMEQLTSIYFITNINKLKITHAEKAIYV